MFEKELNEIQKGCSLHERALIRMGFEAALKLALAQSSQCSPKYLGSINSLTEGEIARVQNWRCGKCKWYYEPKDFV